MSRELERDRAAVGPGATEAILIWTADRHRRSAVPAC